MIVGLARFHGDWKRPVCLSSPWSGRNGNAIVYAPNAASPNSLKTL
jgi:hypothetical protein